MVKPKASESSKTVLLVHPDLQALTALQAALTNHRLRSIVARDLPTTLMAITQHYFDAAIVASRIAEEGDGWPVASVLRMVFPNAFIAVLAPSTDVLALKAAINSGINEVYEKNSTTPEVITGAVVARVHTAALKRKGGDETVVH